MSWLVLSFIVGILCSNYTDISRENVCHTAAAPAYKSTDSDGNKGDRVPHTDK